jgi:protein-tyrosine phosphatase
MLTKVEDYLWVGNAADGRDINLVCQAQFDVVVDLAIEEPPICLPRELSYFRIPLEDGGEDDLRRVISAIRTIAFSITQEMNTLVCCSAGLSRSPAIAAAAIAIKFAKNLDQSLREVASAKRCDVTPMLWRSVVEAHRVIRGDSCQNP